MTSLTKHPNTTHEKLRRIKKDLKLVALDYDGTIYNRKDVHFTHETAVNLIMKIKQKFNVAIITARASTAMKILVPSLIKRIVIKPSKYRIFIGGGNGAMLYELEKNGIKEIYNNGLSYSEIYFVVQTYKEISQKLNLKRKEYMIEGLKTWKNYLAQDWSGFIDDDILDLSKPYKGIIFTEKAKVAIVQPSSKDRKLMLIKNLQKELADKYMVVAGDIDINITKKCNIDGKVMAIKKILNILKLTHRQVVTFGDLPEDNDRGLLSFPYSFTNATSFFKEKNDYNKPPYMLLNSDISPIGCVYQALNYLLRS